MGYLGKPAQLYNPMGSAPFRLKESRSPDAQHVQALACLTDGTLVSSVGTEGRLVAHEGWDLPANTPNLQQHFRQQSLGGTAAKPGSGPSGTRGGRRRPGPTPIHSVFSSEPFGVCALAALSPLHAPGSAVDVLSPLSASSGGASGSSAYEPWRTSAGLFAAGDRGGRVHLFDAGADRGGHLRIVGEHEGQVVLALAALPPQCAAQVRVAS
jgi:hypothetical protein